MKKYRLRPFSPLWTVGLVVGTVVGALAVYGYMVLLSEILNIYF